MIVAYCKNRGIGISNTLPWKIPNELKYFKKVTTSKENDCVVMGKNTWLSLPKKPLAKRKNIVLSSSLKMENAIVFNNKEDLLKYITKKKDNVWVIGGETIYKSFIKSEKLDKIYVTFINEDFECDRFFPEIPKNFKCIEKGSYNNVGNIFYRFEIYQRV